jgi:hypothetical protein
MGRGISAGLAIPKKPQPRRWLHHSPNPAGFLSVHTKLDRRDGQETIIAYIQESGTVWQEGTGDWYLSAALLFGVGVGNQGGDWDDQGQCGLPHPRSIM